MFMCFHFNSHYNNHPFLMQTSISPFRVEQVAPFTFPFQLYFSRNCFCSIFRIFNVLFPFLFIFNKRWAEKKNRLLFSPWILKALICLWVSMSWTEESLQISKSTFCQNQFFGGNFFSSFLCQFYLNGFVAKLFNFDSSLPWIIMMMMENRLKSWKKFLFLFKFHFLIFSYKITWILFNLLLKLSCCCSVKLSVSSSILFSLSLFSVYSFQGFSLIIICSTSWLIITWWQKIWNNFLIEMMKGKWKELKGEQNI